MRMNQIFAPLLALFSVSTLTMCAPSGPTLNDLQAITCPSSKPFICLPYGACCSGSQFCHSGLCETCFPLDIEESALLEWCREKGQFDVTLMRHRGCRLACQYVFNSSQLAHYESWATVSTLDNSTTPTSFKLHDATEDNDPGVEMWIIMLMSVCLVLSVSLNIVLVRKLWNSLKLKGTKTTVNSENSIKAREIYSSPNLGGDPKLDEEGKSLLHESRDNKKNEDLVIQVENDDIDLANKKESKRDSTAAQLNSTGRQVPAAQMISAINETHQSANHLINRESLKISLHDVKIHNEQEKSQDIPNVNISNPQHSPQSQKRKKQKLSLKTNGSSDNDLHQLPLLASSTSNQRSSGEEMH